MHLLNTRRSVISDVLLPVSILNRIIKKVLNVSLLNTRRYTVKIKDKWSNPKKGTGNLYSSWCISEWKGSP